MEEREKELIFHAIRGDERAFHQLVDLHARHLFGVAYGMLGKASDAEDAVQETFLAAYKGLRQFEQRSSLRTWLVAVLTRQVALIRRKQVRWPRMGLEGQGEESMVSPATGAGEVDAKLDVHQVLQRLSEEHREILLLREFEGLSYEEIATALGVAKGTVESRLYRARQELKQKLEGYSQETDHERV